MKHVWDAKDIQPGLIVGTVDDKGGVHSLAQVGYNPVHESSEQWQLNSLEDGLSFADNSSKEHIAIVLTTGNYVLLPREAAADAVRGIVAGNERRLKG